jgi:hypothetical protein
MKSAQINKYGSSELVEINQNTPEPTLSSGKVLVTIKAAGVNPADWKIREGGLQQMISLQFPFTLGWIFLALSNKLGKWSLVQSLSKEMRYMDSWCGKWGIRSICRNSFGKDRRAINFLLVSIIFTAYS